MLFGVFSNLFVAHNFDKSDHYTFSFIIYYMAVCLKLLLFLYFWIINIIDKHQYG